VPEMFQTAKVTVKGIGNGAIRQATYNFHCNYVSILHRFRDIITYFPSLKEVT